jgi:hypothetical protein
MLSFLFPIFVPLADNTLFQGQANIHLPIRYHHVAVHCQAERLPK